MYIIPTKNRDSMHVYNIYPIPSWATPGEQTGAGGTKKVKAFAYER